MTDVSETSIGVRTTMQTADRNLVNLEGITKPLGELTHAATQLAAGRLDHRASTAGTNEVSVLARAFNSLGDSLQRNETIRRQMVSDIAHELRNPLATIGGTLEAIEDQVYEPTPAVLGSLNEEVTRWRALGRAG